MATAVDLVLSEDHNRSFQLVHDGLVAQGFEVTRTPSGGLLAKRGSLGATVLLGGLAGKKFHISFVADFMTGPDGRLVARLTRDMTSGALKGGAVGAAKTGTAFRETADGLAEQLTQAGMLSQRIDHE